MAQNGIEWHTMAQNGTHGTNGTEWHKMAHNSTIRHTWHKMAQNGRQWPKMAKYGTQYTTLPSTYNHFVNMNLSHAVILSLS